MSHGDLTNDGGPAIQTRGLSTTFGGQVAVDGVDLSIREGELIALSRATPWRSSALGVLAFRRKMME